MHVRLGDLDVVQPDDRIDFDRVRVEAFAHDLPMHLAFGGNINHEIATEPGLTAEPATLFEGAALVGVTLLNRVPGRCVIRAGEDRVFGEIAVGDFNLAARANTAAAADGVEIDADFSRGFEQGNPVLEFAALAGGGEDDAVFGQRRQPAGASASDRTWPRYASIQRPACERERRIGNEIHGVYAPGTLLSVKAGFAVDMQRYTCASWNTSPPRAVSVVLNVTEDGRIIIPAQALSELGVASRERVSASLLEGEFVVDTLDAAVKTHAGRISTQFIPEDVSLVDELIAERRAEAARE